MIDYFDEAKNDLLKIAMIRIFSIRSPLYLVDLMVWLEGIVWIPEITKSH